MNSRQATIGHAVAMSFPPPPAVSPDGAGSPEPAVSEVAGLIEAARTD